MAKYSIGLDYGTLSARAILVDIETGETIAQSIYPYPHAVMESHIPDGAQLPAGWALQDPQDYLEAMVDTIQNVVVKSKVLPEEVVGIGVDFTSATVLPVYEDGTALCMTEKFRSEPHAFVKLWKHHGAEKEAVFIDKIARERRHSFQEPSDRPDLRRYPEPPGQSLCERPGMRAGRSHPWHCSCLRGSDRL